MKKEWRARGRTRNERETAQEDLIPGVTGRHRALWAGAAHPLRARPYQPVGDRRARLGQPVTRELAARACFDCHSNETEWLWYTNIAPFFWVIQNYVDEGRRELNFSEWNGDGDFHEIREVINEGEIPPWDYRIVHPAARLNAEEKAALVDGLIATVARSSP